MILKRPDFRTVQVHSCRCQPIVQQLVKHGLFPSAPEQPRIAVALELLGLYRTLFERSCDAVNALAESLHSHYTRRGFHAVDKQGEYVVDPWRRSLGAAIQWHDTLQVEVQKRLDAALDEAAAAVKAASRAQAADWIADLTTSEKAAASRTQAADWVADLSAAEKARDSLADGEASRLLQARCPACFAGNKWGRSFDEGGDFHMSIDGNHHHRHQASSGEVPHFYNPQYFLSKDEVDAVGVEIDAARKRPARKYNLKVPEEAIVECQDSHTAANANKQKADTGHFDDTGVAALVCRHGIPIFFANIDTPGEQQKYAIALIRRVFSELPPEATGAFLYDIGCVLDVSVNKYDILSDAIMKRIMFATTAMHAYAHQWSCQLMYNPRLKPGLGLTDGEGVERLWSRMRRLIGVTRTAGRRRRLWILDRQLTFIGFDMRSGLGDWIRRKLKSGVVDMTSESNKILATCGASEAELREQWGLQVEAQISLRAHAPKRLKKEVEAVFALQDDVAAVEKVIDDARGALSQGKDNRGTKASLQELRDHHRHLLDGVEKLYASLNVHENFPELEGVDINFVRILLLARDSKINIRKRAVGSFLEWERLDQAVGGKHQALGTKAHQRTRQAITRRKPALLRAIHTFNKYCAQLVDLHDPSWAIPLPQPLPTNLSALRDRSDLMEDVWISRREEEMPRWLADSSVRNGIRAVLKKDGCLRERRRLGREADSLCRWLGKELSAVELVLHMETHSSLHVLLAEQRRQLLFLLKRWSTPLASDIRFQTAAREATRTAQRLAGMEPEVVLDWMAPMLAPNVVMLEEDISDQVSEPEPSAYPLDSDNLIVEDDLEDVDDANSDDEVIIELASSTLEPLPSRRFHVSVDSNTLQQFLSPTAMLNDESINGAAMLLQTQLLNCGVNAAASVAILSTHALVCARYGTSDDQLWRGAKNTLYWTKDVWILPIHRPATKHWVLCVVYPLKKKLHLFDSFAEQTSWHTETKVIMTLIARLSCIARKNNQPCSQYDFEDWIAQPLLVEPAQTNGYDCGIWILAVVDAVLRGHDTTSCKEQDMVVFRQCLLNLMLQLPKN
ncbi:hypothetical protein FIBSPDRAFT_994208 [Athelia psychrophila]|uniref:Ubiquitin-like protease family profile domain-containing protein n=1 Tax=Athelia psychrophila TaxID=1759441 RepID=A0A166RUS6_9AGAM|nr:hypothetical protein FIBSPDRAFT_994208 [Fibularhizoctonia sp. CBS 109695]